MKTKTKIINFAVSKEEARLIHRISKRAMEFVPKGACPIVELDMDLTACHANGMPLDFEKLLAFPDFDFVHDVFGIRRHINRQTGELEDCFVPRSATK